MAVFSKLNSVVLRSFSSKFIRSGLPEIPKSGTNAVLARFMSHGHKRTLEVRTGTFEYRKWKDLAHFYTALGLIPMGIVIFLVNVFVGPAELADIPEGYEPKHWEYYKHPISRWLSKNMHYPPVRYYEQHLHVISEEMERVKLRKMEARVRELMSQRGDVKGWYYIPYNAQRYYGAREDSEWFEASMGTNK